MKCINCHKDLKTRFQLKYCSNKCQIKYQYKRYINDWENGKKDGNRGVLTRNLSNHLKRYIIDSSGEKCSLCNWKRRNIITGNVPLEIDHIDGNAENNKKNNLRLICPNCHSLTPHFRNLNKGNGRKWRR